MRKYLINKKLFKIFLVGWACYLPLTAFAQQFGALAWGFATYDDKPSIVKINSNQLTPNPITSGQSSVGLLFPAGSLHLVIEQESITPLSITQEISPSQSHIIIAFNSTKILPDGTMVDESDAAVIPAVGQGNGNHFRLLYVGSMPEIVTSVNGTPTTLRRLQPSQVLNTGSIKVEISGDTFQIAPGDPEDLLVIIYEDRGQLKHMSVSDQNLINPTSN